MKISTLTIDDAELDETTGEAQELWQIIPTNILLEVNWISPWSAMVNQGQMWVSLVLPQSFMVGLGESWWVKLSELNSPQSPMVNQGWMD